MNKINKKWQLKIICLLLAIVLWFIIIGEQNPMSEGSYTVPVTVENLDSQYITSNVPKTLYVRLSGPRNTIINVGPADIKAYIDLSEAQEGEMDVPVHVEIPAGTELKKQSLTTTKITVDVYAVKEFKLTPHLTGKLDDPYFVSKMEIIPEKVVVSGARRLINQVDKAVVDVPVASHNTDFSLMMPVHLFQADGSPVEGLEMTPWQSNVKVSVSANAVSKSVPLNLNLLGSTVDKQVSIQPTSVVVRGEAETIKPINAIDLPEIDVGKMRENKTWKVLIPPQDGVDMEPDEVEVTLTVKGSE